MEAAVLQAETVAARKAPAEINGDGALLPSLIVGVGAVGMTVLQKLRDNLCRRFGCMAQAPHLRLLLLDTDPDVVRTATAGRPGAALAGSEVLLAPLNRPSYYLRPRDGKPGPRRLAQPQDALPHPPVAGDDRRARPGPTGLLRQLPHYRPPLANGVGRLLGPGQLFRSPARQSGLGLRTNRPRVYVVANLAGATGGGIFLDLAYTLRALLRQMGYAQPDVVGLLLLPPVDRCRTRVLPLGNACAALTELRHYSSPDSVFTAQYHKREAPIRDAGTALQPVLPAAVARRSRRGGHTRIGRYGRPASLSRPLFSAGKTADLGRAESAAAAVGSRAACTIRRSGCTNWSGRVTP